MPLRPLIWPGFHFNLLIKRHWNTFFSLATVFEIEALRMEKILPRGAGIHIMMMDELVEEARAYFASSDDWWRFSKVLCDHYCDYYVLERPHAGNPFNQRHHTYLNDKYAVQNFAKASRGYNGPEQWKSFI